MGRAAACSCFLFAFFDLVLAVVVVIPAAVPVGKIVVDAVRVVCRRPTTTGAPRGCEDGAGSSLRSLLAGDGQAQVSAPAVCVCSGSPTDSLGPLKAHTPAHCYCRRRAHRCRRHSRRRRRRPRTVFTRRPLSTPTVATPAAPPRARDARVRSLEGPADVLAPRPLRAVGRRLLVPRQAQHDRALDLHRASRRAPVGGPLLMISITRNTVRNARASPPTRTPPPQTCPRT
jgi:hypothetical protein